MAQYGVYASAAGTLHPLDGQRTMTTVEAVERLNILTAENGRLTNAIKDLIGGYEMRLPELNKSYSMYRSKDDIAGCGRIAARVDEVQRLIDALRAIIKEG